MKENEAPLLLSTNSIKLHEQCRKCGYGNTPPTSTESLLVILSWYDMTRKKIPYTRTSYYDTA